MFLDYYIYYLYYSFLGYPFVIRFSTILITVFVLLLVVSALTINRSRRMIRKKRKTHDKMEKRYADKMRRIITADRHYSPDDISSIMECNVKKLTEREKRMLTNNILRIKDKQPHTNEYNYKRLIDFLELKRFWERKLQHGSLASKQRALRKLDDFDIEIQGSIINALTYNRNQYLRKRARSSYMYFSKIDPFKFLDEDFDKTFNDWDKVVAHRVLNRRAEKEKLPVFTQWIKNSSNVKFQCFMIDEVKFFQQHESIPFLLELIDSHNIELRKHSIDALGEMEYQEAEPQLMKDFILQPLPVQRSIMIAVRRLNTGKALPFLEEAYYNAHDIESKLIALTSILEYNEQGKALFDKMERNADPFSKQLFEHVANPLLKKAN